MCSQTPTVYRSMYELNGHPKLGSAFCCLGARIPHDIKASTDGQVHPGIHGMSVDHSKTTMHCAVFPKRLRDAVLAKYGPAVPAQVAALVSGARGDPELRIWRRGKGAYAAGVFADGLMLAIRSDDHGLVGPDSPMSPSVYSQKIGDTQPSWQIDEVI